MIKKTLKAVCLVFGHQWRYKDYSNWMKPNGDKYHFSASRYCTVCNQNEYLNKNWEKQNEKSVHDVERNSHSSKHPPQFIY